MMQLIAQSSSSNGRLQERIRMVEDFPRVPVERCLMLELAIVKLLGVRDRRIVMLVVM
jgi:hypothetical protein